MLASPSRIASKPRGCHGCSSVATSWSLVTVKVVGFGSFLARTLGSPDAWKVRLWSISPKPTGVNILDTVSSWWIRARTTSAPNNSCVGKERSAPPICCDSYRWIAADQTPAGNVLGTLVLLGDACGRASSARSHWCCRRSRTRSCQLSCPGTFG